MNVSDNLSSSRPEYLCNFGSGDSYGRKLKKKSLKNKQQQRELCKDIKINIPYIVCDL